MGMIADAILDGVKQADPAMGNAFEKALNDNPAFTQYLDGMGVANARQWGDALKANATPANTPAFEKILSDISTAGTNGTNFDFSQLDAANMASTLARYNSAPAPTPTPAPTPAPTPTPTPAPAPTPTATAPTFPMTYPEFSTYLKSAGDTELTKLAEKLDRTGDDFQGSLMYAINENPHFRTYLATGSGPNANLFLTETVDELFIKEEVSPGILRPVANPGEAGADLMDPQKAQIVQNILTEVGNGDRYQNLADFQLLDDVKEASQILKALPSNATPEQTKAATKDYYLALEAAGGHLPAFAHLDFSDVWEYIVDIFDPNVGPDAALDNLIQKSGLDPSSEAAGDLRHMGGIIGKFTTFVGGDPGSGGYGDLVHNAANGAHDHQIGAVKGVINTVQRGTSGTTVLTHEQQMNEASRVADVDDAHFMAKVEDHLRGVAAPDLGSVFDAMRHATGTDARAEINAIQNAVNTGDVTLTASFQDALNRRDFSKIAETLNKTYNGLEEGDTPSVAANDSQFALTAP